MTAQWVTTRDALIHVLKAAKMLKGRPEVPDYARPEDRPRGSSGAALWSAIDRFMGKVGRR